MDTGSRFNAKPFQPAICHRRRARFRAENIHASATWSWAGKNVMKKILAAKEKKKKKSSFIRGRLRTADKKE